MVERQTSEKHRPFKVYYDKNPHLGAYHVVPPADYQPPTTASMKDTHVFVRELEAQTLEEIFRLMQAEMWSPSGEMRDYITSLGLKHTSMSAGDIAEDEDGHFFECLLRGWRKMA